MTARTRFSYIRQWNLKKSEAKNDSDVIQKEIEDIAELIELGEYDDALMQIKALSTKNLTEEQKATIQEVIEFLEGKTAKGLSD